ncbi:ribose-phosphate pyrophosphokinase [Candidatus Hakubella thermalkaliphila]|uniref:Ribose-phosphate pyrophosphokinase n=1 Tax=Candidatus Hakubella thermalkaliphila TaxID=2754717 RepID=A0A6V8PJ62_9ACTN|nr:ribose-phosphate pyrophosphokinase [Candidatus Hakubella thermalkaliphila]
MSDISTKRLMLFSGSSNLELAKSIATELGCGLGKVKLDRFSDGEIYVKYLESVRGADVFVLQTCSHPINENIMELLVMIDALKRASARCISAVMPYFGYARQDKKISAREPITSKLLADLVSTAGADRVLSMDLHAGQIQGFFNVPVDHLTAIPLLASYFKEKNFENAAVVSPDVGGVKRASKFADRLHASLAIMDKRRSSHNVAAVLHVIGDVRDKSVIIVDDLIDTAGTVIASAEYLLTEGAKEVYVTCTHAVLSGQACQRLREAPIKEVVVTDTVPIPEEKRSENLTVISVSSILAKTIRHVYGDESVSELFEGDNLL